MYLTVNELNSMPENMEPKIYTFLSPKEVTPTTHALLSPEEIKRTKMNQTTLTALSPKETNRTILTPLPPPAIIPEGMNRELLLSFLGGKNTEDLITGLTEGANLLKQISAGLVLTPLVVIPSMK
nr:hypothetical protein [Tanacetum cinerariifolium]